MVKKKLALWLVLILIVNLFAGMAGFSETTDSVLPVAPAPPAVNEPVVENPVTTGSAVQTVEAEVKTAETGGVPDISVPSSEAELNAIPLEQTENYFLVRYEDGTREIRKKSVPMMQALASEAEPVPTTEDLVELYDQKNAVLYAEPIIIFHMTEAAAATPQDPVYTAGNLWGFDAIKAQQAFGRVATESLADVVVAVVDSGVNYNHQDLNDAVYKVNGSVVGKDYIDTDLVPLDQNGHGTHVAGTIAAEANAMDTVGVAAGVKIMPVRVLDASGGGTNVNVANGIIWAADNGAKIINLSLGSRDESEEVTLAVQHAIDAGVLVVAASGNGDPVTNLPGDNFDIDDSEPGVNVKPMLYPAALPPVLSVGSIGQVFSGATFTGKYRLSNFSCAVTTSSAELDVCAPGEYIYSTGLAATGVVSKNGTSMATPHVTAVAALLKAQDSSRTSTWIINRIKATTQVGVYDDTKYYDDVAVREKFYGKGLVNSLAALGYFNASIGSITNMITLPSTIEAVRFEENSPGDYLQYLNKSLTLKLPSGYHWIAVPTVSMSGGFAATTATVVNNDEILSITPDYSGATTASAGVIILTGAQVNATSPSAVADLRIEVSGEALATTASLKAADFMGNYLSSLNLGGVALSPGFNRSVNSYTASVSSATTTTSFSTIKEYPDSVMAVTLNGASYASGDLNLIQGNNRLIVTVTGPGGVRTYQVDINRSLPDAPGTVVSIGDSGNTALELPAVITPGTDYTFNITTSTATLDLGTPVGNAVTVAATMSFITTLSGSTVSVTMPAGLTTTASAAGWNGVLNLPEIKSSSNADIGGGAIGRVVDIGLPTNALTFSAPVRILMPGMGGKSVKWYRNGTTTAITTVLASDTAGALGGNSDGYIVLPNNDLVIWTKHFTEFVAYTPAPVNTGDNTTGGNTTSGGGGGGGGGGGVGYNTVRASEDNKIIMASVAVEIPAGAIRSDTTLKTTIMEFSDNKLQAQQRLISDVWGITLLDNIEFLKPMNLKLNYAPSKIDKTSEKLSIYWLDEKAGRWIQLTNSKANLELGYVTAETTKQGYFALIAEKGATPVVTVVQPIETIVSSINLTDIQGHWANASIQKLIALKAISGNPDGTFQPEKQVTRAEFITMLVKALGLKGTSDKAFSDLQGHWASGAVSTAVANGIVNGFADGTVAPDSLITREQMAVMIAKALKLSAGKTDKAFTDADSISPWAQDAIASAMSNGIIGGYADGTFKPQGMATKAEAVTIIAKGIK